MSRSLEGLDAFWQELLLSKGKNVVATALSSSDGAACDQVPKESRVGATRRMKWLAAPYLHSAWGDRIILHKHHAEPGRTGLGRRGSVLPRGLQCTSERHRTVPMRTDIDWVCRWQRVKASDDRIDTSSPTSYYCVRIRVV